jgi:hypothetical protein
LRRREAPPYQFGHARHLALEEILARSQFAELRPRFAIIKPGEHLALGDLIALAITNLHDPIADQAADLRPVPWLDCAGGVNDLHRGAAHRRDRGHGRPAAVKKPPPSRQRRERQHHNGDSSPVHDCPSVRFDAVRRSR